VADCGGAGDSAMVGAWISASAIRRGSWRSMGRDRAGVLADCGRAWGAVAGAGCAEARFGAGGAQPHGEEAGRILRAAARCECCGARMRRARCGRGSSTGAGGQGEGDRAEVAVSDWRGGAVGPGRCGGIPELERLHDAGFAYGLLRAGAAGAASKAAGVEIYPRC